MILILINIKIKFYSINYNDLSINKIYKKFDNLIDVEELSNNNEIVDYASDLLKSNNIIAWFQSSSEWGPRALGRRSILANPSNKSVVEEINLKLKKEKF